MQTLTKTTTHGETVIITKDSAGDSVRLTVTGGANDGAIRWHDVHRMTREIRGTGIVLTEGEWKDLGATYEATQAQVTPERGIAAKFAGTCTMSGERYGKGARIERTQFGWALVGADLDVTYNMGREDSPL